MYVSLYYIFCGNIFDRVEKSCGLISHIVSVSMHDNSWKVLDQHISLSFRTGICPWERHCSNNNNLFIHWITVAGCFLLSQPWPLTQRSWQTDCSLLPLWRLSDAADTDCFDIGTGSLFATDCAKIKISPCWLAVSSCHKISAFSVLFCGEDVMDKNVKIQGLCSFYSFLPWQSG